MALFKLTTFFSVFTFPDTTKINLLWIEERF